MRSMLLSTALTFIALISSGCATLTNDQGCGVDAAGASGNCGVQGVRIGGLLGRLRGQASCNDTGCNGCQGGVALGGRLGTGIVGAAGCLNGNCGIGGRGMLGNGFGRASGSCQGCGLLGGNCNCGLLGNHAPYTPDFMGAAGPETGHYRYPYYTTRAPRDFLMSNPPSIGR